MDVWIIDVSQNSRSLDTSQSQPKSLDKIQHQNTTLLGAMIHSLKQGIEVRSIHYVGGYHLEKVVDAYPELTFHYLADDQRAKLGQMLHEMSQGNTLILLGHYMYLPETFKHVIHQINSVGLVKHEPVIWHLSSSSVANLSQRLEVGGAGSCEDVLKDFTQQQLSTSNVKSVDVLGLCANSMHVNEVSRLILSGKAKTLERLSSMVKSAVVLDSIRVSATNWDSNRHELTQNIMGAFSQSKNVVVRSSAYCEDSKTDSFAGYFDSILDVGVDETSIQNAIDRVFESYRKNGRSLHPKDEVLVQSQVEQLFGNGVLFTRTLDTYAPYHVISYDETFDSKDGVTSGQKQVQNMFVSWEAPESAWPEAIRNVIPLANELIELLGDDALDIEFGIDKEGTVYLFQVRPMVLKEKENFREREILDSLLLGVQFIERHQDLNQSDLNSQVLLSNMSDWNPAEMIGLHPRPLAFSLYHELITQSSWAQARANLGYQDMSGTPLMLNILGTPYIDVKASMHSLIPGTLLSSHQTSLWMDGQYRALKKQPNLHDKIEFEVAINALSPNWNHYEQKLIDYGLDPHYRDQIKEGYRVLTQSIIDGFQERVGSWEQEHLLQLERARSSTLNYPKDSSSLIQLIDLTKKHGIIPFAEFARMAFIGLSYLREFVELGALTQQQMDEFLFQIPTVASNMILDQQSWSKGELTSDELIQKYGHLRPKSYDIESDSYRDCPEQYLFTSKKTESVEPKSIEKATESLKEEYSTIEAILADLQLNCSASSLLTFIAQSIQLRESAKFEFMKNIDSIISCCKSFGETLGFTMEETSFLTIHDLMQSGYTSAVYGDKYQLRKIMRFNKKRWQLTSKCLKPDFISNPSDVLAFKQMNSKPNFITQSCVEATLINVIDQTVDLEGAIVLIEAADPGYDWIFSHKIKGLITAFGGMASHMAIRASEFGIPAAIGCGHATFTKLMSANVIQLDCSNQVIEVRS